jgi:DNA-binding transcriptional MocR family regulator
MTAALWPGPVHVEARAAYARAREAGLSLARAMVIGAVASFRDCWMFRRKLAEKLGLSVRTVQRALTQGEAEGLIGKARAKQGEKPPNMPEAIPCGWSHRWTIGWGQAGKLVQSAVAAAKARWLIRQVKPVQLPKRPSALDPERPARQKTPYQRREWTAEQLDAELAKLEREHKPPG